MCSSVLLQEKSFAVLLKKKLAQVHHGGALLEDVRAEAWWILVDGLPDADGTSPFSLELTLERQQVFLR